MIIPKTHNDLLQLIADGVEESVSLDYKAADALQNTDGKKKEIAKDVSAMANSAGGVIIYGISEFNDQSKKHLPEKITPIDRTLFSKEQLEQIINNNISPKIEELIIHPITLNKTNEVAYVVEIPQSNTAHQNTKDQRYYKRYNFESVAMLDYEIKDIMNRQKHPSVELTFTIEKFTYEIARNSMFPSFKSNQIFPYEPPKKQYKTIFTLKIIPNNYGKVYAQFVNYFIKVPLDILNVKEIKYSKKPEHGIVEIYGENTIRDIVDTKLVFGNVFDHKYGPSRFDPILPGLYGRAKEIELSDHPKLDDREIAWEVYADNANIKRGSIRLDTIDIIEKQQEVEAEEEMDYDNNVDNE